ncbi:hypothetical protein GCM10027446_06710 [Angustibacter peucedani]
MSTPAGARRAAVVLAALAGVLNVNFLAEWLLPHRTPVAVTVVSDLAAPGRAWDWVFRTGDTLSAALLLVVCVLAWRAAVTSPAWRAATVLLGVFAVTTVLAVLVPEGCTASTDPSCGGLLGGGGLSDAVHDVVSTLGSTCGLAAALCFAVATRRTRSEPALHLAALALAGALGLAFLVAQATGATSWLGWTQRGQIVVLSAWFAVVGWSVDRRRQPPATMRA